ncbi:hypothetical protein [Pedobacter boryungensis]|uniref:Carboxypeptidase regulatory-like domain-containing protein n=1 Tax=Pedobacter boryungensis TaxID=869962 RepID=A0ABX2DCS3_9SPHI|nr:hypothetical protein [Pedobacter boryungensis]NQX31888.1 hypothetical protein [Pedobacter boryungensis]
MNKISMLLLLLLSSCSLFNKQSNDNFDCARYTILHDFKFARKNSAEDSVTIQGVTRYCDDKTIAKGTIVRIIDENDKVVSYTTSDNKGRYKLLWKSGAFKISAVNPGGGIVETSLIDFGLYSMSTNISLYMQHPNAFIEKMEDSRIRKN